MLHGPHTDNSPCLRKNCQCSKKFPKKFIEQTEINEKGYPHYRRRNNRAAANNYNSKVNGQLVLADNSMVVPYNPYLLKKYNCHINVECCSSVAACCNEIHS